MGGWFCDWIDGWMDGRTNGRTNGWMITSLFLVLTHETLCDILNTISAHLSEDHDKRL